MTNELKMKNDSGVYFIHHVMCNTNSRWFKLYSQNILLRTQVIWYLQQINQENRQLVIQICICYLKLTTNNNFFRYKYCVRIFVFHIQIFTDLIYPSFINRENLFRSCWYVITEWWLIHNIFTSSQNSHFKFFQYFDL